MEKIYFCIDMKTFFASVECVDRNLDPFTTNLVVADASRGKGSICLAVTPHLKMLGVKNRCRLFEIPSNIKYITAMPRMKKYIEKAADIYEIYLKYFSANDIHVYSIDEAFMDATNYLKLYNKTPIELAKTIIQDIYDTYGLTATAGIGTNMYLAKIALDIMSKHSADNIGYLDEEKYIKELGNHRPLKDFWQINVRTEARLNRLRIYTMNDIAKADEKRLFKEFGVNSRLMIDHAKGIEPCTIQDIKKYKSKSNSLSTSQILPKDYNFEDAKLAMKEMVEVQTLKLVKNKLKTGSIGLYIGYSKDMIEASKATKKLENDTDVFSELLRNFTFMYDKIVSRNTPIRRIGISFDKVSSSNYMQLNLFEDKVKIEKEERLENTINILKEKIGKNAILKGINLQENATTISRNKMIGGHNAGE